MAGVWLPCRSCGRVGRCALFSEVNRLAVLAWSKGDECPDCLEYKPRLERGVDGVLAPRAPVGFNHD